MADASDRDGDEGFTLIEITVAMFVVMLVMSALLGVLVSSLTSVTQARQRQTATALATQTVERLRALPYDSVTGSNPVTYPMSPDLEHVSMTGSPAVAMFAPSAVLRAVTPAEKLVVNEYSGKRASTTVDGVVYVVQTYVTEAPLTTGGERPFHLTAAVSWTSSVHQTTRTTVQRSTTFSAGGCLSTAQHPFAAPCQAYFIAQAGQSAGAFSLTHAEDATQAVPGFDGSLIALGLPTLSTHLGIEQTASTHGSVATSSARTLKPLSTGQTGAAPAAASVDSDPSSVPNQQVTTSTPAQTSSALDLTSAFGRLVARPGSSDAGEASAAVGADTTSCTDGTSTGTGLVTGPAGGLRPCSSARVQQVGAVASLTYHDGAGSVVDLLTLQPAPGRSRAVAANLAAPQAGVACTASTTLVGVGCGHAAAHRAVGTLVVGSVAGATDPTLAPEGLWTLQGLAETTVSESGSGARPGAASRSGSLRVWTGTGYAPVNLSSYTSPADGTSETWTSPLVARAYAGGLTVTMEGTVTVTRPSLSSSGPSGCKATACAAQVNGGSVRALTTFTILQGGVEKSRFALTSDLGELLARSSFKAAPDA